MTIDLPPQYDPKSVESRIYKMWLDSGAFHAVPDSRPPEKRFSVVIPPPNVTGALHLGHAINGTIQDILIRYHRMKGDNTMWMPGIDHAGIATQAVVEKTIFEKEKKTRHDLGREELVKRIWQWKEQFGTRILAQLQSIGSSCDWDRTRFTLDDICAKAVREAFFKMFKDGLIFRGKRLVNWDTHLQTAVADDEIYHEAVKGQLTSIKYPVEGSPDEYMVVATTRPETMLGDTAVAVHPDDPRYKHLIGKHVILPLIGRKIPIIADGLLVDPKFGTGVVKVTPAHDPNDYATGQRHNLEMINLLTPDGKVNENGQSEGGGFLGKKYSYTGLKFATAARKAVLADLESLGLIAETKVHEHEIGHSDRSKTPIEPYLSDQWFVRMGDRGIGVPADDRPEGAIREQGITLANGQESPGLAQAAIDAVKDGRVKITPDRYAKGYIDWLGQKRDWCISRQLWWGHRIPVWSYTLSEQTRSEWTRRSKGGNSPFNIPDADSKALQILKEVESTWSKWEARGESNRGPELASIGPTLLRGVSRTDAASAPLHDVDAPSQIFICLREDKPEIIQKIESAGFTRDPDVLDTWFSSALWPLSTMGWPPTPVVVNGASVWTFVIDNAFFDRMEPGDKHRNPQKVAEHRKMVLFYELDRSVANQVYGDKQDDHSPKLLVLDHSAPPGILRIVAQNEGASKILEKIALELDRRKAGKEVMSKYELAATYADSITREMRCSISDKPEDQLLPYFYPTSLLSTAREILTLWVARMVIFGLYLRGEVPFKNVYIHAVIQDGEGRPMKKTLGNGVDPVDIVNSHGADALRFTLASMATETQDIRMPVVKDPKSGINTSPKFDLGRNFANKIWNASRYVLSNIGEQTTSIENRKSKIENLEDRWILLRLHATIQSAESAIHDYRFADLANNLYQFFWSDVCDWYLEIAKARIKSNDQTVQSILLHCLKTSLQLLHPIMPFITEELWSKLPGHSTMLITAPWPAFDPAYFDPQAELRLLLIQDVTTAIREIQNRYPAAKVGGGKPVILQPGNAATQEILNQSRAIIEPLAGVTIAENSPSAQKPDNAATAVLPQVQIFIPGVIDKSAESAKLAKRREELLKFIASGKTKLDNAAAVAKAPPNVVKGWRDQLAKQQEELTAIEKNLAELQ